MGKRTSGRIVFEDVEGSKERDLRPIQIIDTESYLFLNLKTMKLTVLISDELISEVMKVSKAKNITEALKIALS